MTLILNEIHLLNGLQTTLLIATADRQITKQDGTFDSLLTKLFAIPYLNGAVSYFGLATVYPKGQSQYLSTWMPDFIRRHSSADNLQSFAERLRNEVSQIISPAVLQTCGSGFHICGYNSMGLPDFWYFSNIGGMKGFQYIDLKPQYTYPKSHFLCRGATKVFGWDGNDPLSAKNGVQVYRNGDFRAHVAAWESLDEIFGRLFQFPDFKLPANPNEYGEYVKFKFEFIAYLYRKWAKKKIIGRPIDVLVLHSPNQEKN